MDQLSAHLDRGWDLVQRGDAAGAELSGRRALDLDKESPEAHNLLGFVAALRGDFDTALEHYREAIDLDDTYLEAMLNAAEILTHPLGEFDQALELCDQAVELVQSDDELIDVLLLQFDVLLAKDDLDAARSVAAAFPPGPFENPAHGFMVARAYFELEDLDKAAPLLEEAVRSTPENPDVQYYWAMTLDERGDTAGATRAFLRVRALDLALPSPPWSLSVEGLEQLAMRVIESLPEARRARLADCQLVVAESPGAEVVCDWADPRAVMLLDLPSFAPGEPAPPPRLFVYQRNLERVAGVLERVEPELRATLEHELEALEEHESHSSEDDLVEDAPPGSRRPTRH